MKNTIQVGDLISTRHGTSKIKKIELCEKPGGDPFAPGAAFGSGPLGLHICFPACLNHDDFNTDSYH